MRSLFIFTLASVVTLSLCVPVRDIVTFEQFKHTFNKTYTSVEEEAIRKANFEKTLKWIVENRAHHPMVEFEINHLADLSDEEYRSQGVNHEELKSMFEALDVAPEVKYSPLRAGWVDWRNKMTAVKDQGTCGSCWAFATVATIEAQYIIRQNRELNLSEQELLDCSSVGDYSNHGCNGGSAPQALKYVLDHGITTESVYPYRNQQFQCPDNVEFSNNKFEIGNFYLLRHIASDEDIMQVLYNEGPAAIAIDSESNVFRNYRSGIMRNVLPNVQYSNHIVAIVGYGTENGIDYWLIRNSWGTEWGLNGYGFVERHHNNMGINNYVAYPKL